MKAIFNDSNFLDQNAINLGLSEDLLMENAGLSLANLIKKELKKLKKSGVKKPKVLFLLGGGKNAADGLVALRHLKKCKAFKLDLRQSEAFKRQEQIYLNFGYKFAKKMPNFKRFDMIIDCIFGSGFKNELSENLAKILQKVNKTKALKIACDMPSGLGTKLGFKADITLSMGCLKEILLEDKNKAFVGRLKIGKLGVSTNKLVKKADGFLLEKSDLKLIKRSESSHKGEFGHIFIAGGGGAAQITGLAGLNFGAGLATILQDNMPSSYPTSPLLMTKPNLDANADVLVAGMNLKSLEILQNPLCETLPLVLDANCFLAPDLSKFLRQKNVVITPHPLEFVRLFKTHFKESLSVNELQQNRFFYVRKFSAKFECVLVLKGANTIIAQKEQIFVVNLGTPALAKGGSGDALAGMIGALLGAKFSAISAAKNAVLAHALMAKKWQKQGKNANAFDALKLIRSLKCL